ncbi:MAG: hypothetical protein OEY94_10190 [Alphaproteobacteria bacterium]|nr:hypothetical protein [Alphaproteobacteria bacterium]
MSEEADKISKKSKVKMWLIIFCFLFFVGVASGVWVEQRFFYRSIKKLLPVSYNCSGIKNFDSVNVVLNVPFSVEKGTEYNWSNFENKLKGKIDQMISPSGFQKYSERPDLYSFYIERADGGVDYRDITHKEKNALNYLFYVQKAKSFSEKYEEANTLYAISAAILKHDENLILTRSYVFDESNLDEIHKAQDAIIQRLTCFNFSKFIEKEFVEVNAKPSEHVYRIDNFETIHEIEGTSIEQRCEELSKNSGYEYDAVYGKIIFTFAYPNHPCPPNEICKEGQVVSIFNMTSIKPLSDGYTGQFSAYTKPVLQKEFWDMKPFNGTGKKYKFCARKIDEEEFSRVHAKPIDRLYRIDNFETIQEIEGVSLEEKCAKLTRDNGVAFQIISGTVVKSGITPPLPIDCSVENPECVRRKRGLFYAFIEDRNGKKITTLTEPENRNSLINRPLYMKEGRKYAFCARNQEIKGNETRYIIEKQTITEY